MGNRGSYRFRCPFPYIPCQKMRVLDGITTREFECDTTCDDYGGKRKTCVKDMKCFAQPRPRSFLRCSNGELGEQWAGCRNQGSTRIQCPKDHYPCNTLVGNSAFPEFSCSSDCLEKGGNRECGELECYSESRDDDHLLCSDGSVADKWNGCVDKGDGVFRVQCPKDYVPCNDITENGEFKCGTDCSTLGGKRKCYLHLDKDLPCVWTPYDSDKYVCLNGVETDHEDGCIEMGSTRVQCPKGLYPCEKLRSNGEEFQCSRKCTSTITSGRRSCQYYHKKLYLQVDAETVIQTDKVYTPCKDHYDCRIYGANITDIL